MITKQIWEFCHSYDYNNNDFDDHDHDDDDEDEDNEDNNDDNDNNIDKDNDNKSNKLQQKKQTKQIDMTAALSPPPRSQLHQLQTLFDLNLRLLIIIGEKTYFIIAWSYKLLPLKDSFHPKDPILLPYPPPQVHPPTHPPN